MSKEHPLVSVCIPCFNAEDTIAATLDSILAQTYQNIEIIVSDNQSKDRTKKIILAYADKGVRLVENPPVEEGGGRIFGAFDNWDYAFSSGKGDFLCLYHADDLYEPEIVEKEVNFLLARPETGAVFTQRKFIDKNNCGIKKKKKFQPINFKQDREFEFSEFFELLLKRRHFISTPTLMIRKEVIAEVGQFNEKCFATAADLDYFLRINMKFKLGIVNEKLHSYRLSENHATAKIHKMRTSISDYFVVVAHYISLIGVKNISTAALDMHEVYLCTDRIRCSFYLMWLEEPDKALEMVKRGLNWRSLRTIQGWKICFPGVLVYASLVTGLDRIVRSFLNWRFGKK